MTRLSKEAAEYVALALRYHGGDKSCADELLRLHVLLGRRFRAGHSDELISAQEVLRGERAS